MKTRSRILFLTLAAAGLVACGDDPVGGADVLVDTNPEETTDGTVDTDVIDDTAEVGDDVDADIQEDVPDTSDTTPEVDTDETDTAETDDDGGDDTETDTEISENCGNGTVEEGEECDDGNADNSDLCNSDCTAARCGDGSVNLREATLTFDAQVVRGLDGEEGFVCGRGSSCAGEACDVTDDSAPEHGICQALGALRAVSVDWTGAQGAGTAPMLEAYNWACFGYECFAGTTDTDDDCTAGEMLASIVCEGYEPEPCDQGADNSATVPSACRPGCELHVCGDGVADLDEACDDGNTVNNDGCSNNCLLPQCGDGVRQSSEACDDGNTLNTDDCTNVCGLPACGDGFPQITAGEECDDGAANSDLPNACRANCQAAGCGDLILDEGEECDDGNTVNEDGCSNICRLPGCGDLIVQAGEECDDGNDINTDGCNDECIAARCGDGVVNTTFRSEEFDAPIVTNPFGDAGHVCDDGGSCFGSNAGTTCELLDDGGAPEHGICQALGYERCASVTWGGGPGETDTVMPSAFNWECVDFVCGPSADDDATDNCSSTEMLRSIICEGGGLEECDNGDANGEVPNACRPDCSLPACGDGIVDDGEECDDGNTTPADGCSAICRLPACGDGEITEGEQCDDGLENADAPDACRLNCALPACTDGIIDEGEECDDGNPVAEDGCSLVCRVPGCRDGVLQDGEECDDGNDVSDDACDNECLLPVCGDTVVEGEEECDDGNDIETDACIPGCIAATCGDGILATGSPCEILLIVEPAISATATQNLSTVLAEFAGNVVSVVNTAQVGSTDLDMMNDYSLVIFAKEDRTITAAEETALTGFVNAGGTLIVTGYDSMGSPTDPALARVAQVTTAGDGPFSANITVTIDHPYVDGAFGTYAAGSAFTVTSTDHDNVSVTGNTIEILRVNETAAKLTYGTYGSGEVLFWNSNNDFADWNTAGTAQNIFKNLISAECSYAEECDNGDANADVANVCRTDCRLPTCLDGIVDDGEECDDGNSNALDECGNTCLLPVCGDGVQQGTEACDNGDNNANEPDQCRRDCSLPTCLDGIQDRTEECDDGNGVADDGCSLNCRLPGCGDNVVQGEEECDDANTVDDDECTNRCRLPLCGDGIIQGTEACDDGAENSDTADACRTNCELPTCLDGIVDEGEECDDGNDVADDGCSMICRLPGCGDGVTQIDEQCDDGNAVDNDECSNVCQLAYCGDGIHQPAADEQCDDGNDVEDDFCTSLCEGALVDVVLGSAVGDAVYSGTNVGTGADNDVSPCAEFTDTGAEGEDLTFGWIAPTTGTYEIDVCGITWDSVLWATNTADDTVLACIDDGGCPEIRSSAITVDVVEGDRIVITVDGFLPASAGTFDLNINAQ